MNPNNQENNNNNDNSGDQHQEPRRTKRQRPMNDKNTALMDAEEREDSKRWNVNWQRTLESSRRGTVAPSAVSPRHTTRRPGDNFLLANNDPKNRLTCSSALPFYEIRSVSVVEARESGSGQSEAVAAVWWRWSSGRVVGN